METFLDSDLVEVVKITDVKKQYQSELPNDIMEEIFNRFSWDINDGNPSTTVSHDDIMAIEDLNFALAYFNKGYDVHNKDDLNYMYNEHTSCGICGELLLIDDEVYQDEVSGVALCTNHAIMNENTNNYRAIDEEEIEMRNKCSQCPMVESVTFVREDDIVQDTLVCQYNTHHDEPMKCFSIFNKCSFNK